MKLRQYSNSLGAKLSPEQTDSVCQWLAQHTHVQVAAIISAPPPEGLGIATSASAVGRFAINHAEEIAAYEAEALDALVTACKNKYDLEDEFHEDIEQGNFRLLQEKVFLKLAREDPTAHDLKTLASVAKIAGEFLRGERNKLDFEEQRMNTLAKKVKEMKEGQLPKAA